MIRARVPARSRETEEARLGVALTLPAMTVIAAIGVLPIAWSLWQSLHLYDLRMPWLGQPFIGAANYLEAWTDPRVREALLHTLVFVAASVAIELTGGLALALAVERVRRGRGLARTAVLLPWAIPTVVAALVWRFLFESGGAVDALLAPVMATPVWLAHPLAAWVPIILADAWKTMPFVAILLLAGLQSIDESVYEAARIDGATGWRTFTGITLPLLAPALVVAFLFRALDAFRVFDVVYVMTGGGPGTATEPIAIYTFATLMQNLRFGYGSALSVIVFAIMLAVALACIRFSGRALWTEHPK
jgi:ABC-type sugar transport system permease subunit